jgi:hypothetical protein
VADRPISYDARGEVKGPCGTSCGTEGNASKNSASNSRPLGETVEFVFVEVVEDRDRQEMGRGLVGS